MVETVTQPHRNLNIWGTNLDVSWLTQRDIAYLAAFDATPVPSVLWLRSELDRVWDALGLNNESPSPSKIREFYSHPVWLLNGIFSAVDFTSVAHRRALATHIKSLTSGRVADYGGGLGELAKQICDLDDDAAVDIIEPFASRVAQELRQGLNVRFLPHLRDQYDCIIAQDVLEHVEAPMTLSTELVRHVRVGGYLIFANCFYPVIKCHLPSTFYLRHTFQFIASTLGLTFVGRVPGAAHALVFRRDRGELDTARLVALDRMARLVGPILNDVRTWASSARRRLMDFRQPPTG